MTSFGMQSDTHQDRDWEAMRSHAPEPVDETTQERGQATRPESEPGMGTNELPIRETEARRLARPLKRTDAERTDAERTAAIQAHLHDIVHELHHGKGSHDDPDLPDGPTIDLTDEESVSGAGEFDVSSLGERHPETSMQGGF